MGDPVKQMNPFELRQAAIEQRLNEHIIESKMYREEYQEMFGQLLQSTKANTESIGQLTVATAGILEVYAASQGAIKVGSALGKFAKWLTGVAVLGVGFKWMLDHFGGPPLN